MLLRVFLFDEDGNEFSTDIIFDHIEDNRDRNLVAFQALQDAHVLAYSQCFEDYDFLDPHADEKDTNLLLRIREKDSHEDMCHAGSHCSLTTCRDWPTSNLATQVNLRRVEN